MGSPDADSGNCRYSWKYIEQSVRKGVLENLDDHRVGPPIGTVRSAGSSIQPSKGSRTPFTAEDDRILSDWVNGYEELKRATGGNEIYKQLEEKVSRFNSVYAVRLLKSL